MRSAWSAMRGAVLLCDAGPGRDGGRRGGLTVPHSRSKNKRQKQGRRRDGKRLRVSASPRPGASKLLQWRHCFIELCLICCRLPRGRFSSPGHPVVGREGPVVAIASHQALVQLLTPRDRSGDTRGQLASFSQGLQTTARCSQWPARTSHRSSRSLAHTSQLVSTGCGGNFQ